MAQKTQRPNCRKKLGEIFVPLHAVVRTRELRFFDLLLSQHFTSLAVGAGDPSQKSWCSCNLILCTLYRPLRDIRLFPTAMKSRYLNDTIGKHALLPFPFGIRIPQDVIKSKADEL